MRWEMVRSAESAATRRQGGVAEGAGPQDQQQQGAPAIAEPRHDFANRIIPVMAELIHAQDQRFERGCCGIGVDLFVGKAQGLTHSGNGVLCLGRAGACDLGVHERVLASPGRNDNG